MARQLPRLEKCLNCGTEVHGNFCSNCGQEAEDQTVAFRLLISDVAAEIASFDSKLVRTLKPLAFRPGFLTNEYNAGRRASYLSPLKMYLVASLLFFLALSRQNIPVKADLTDTPSAPRTPGKKATVNDPSAINIKAKGISFQPSKLPKTEEEYIAWQRDPLNKHPDSAREQWFIKQFYKLKRDPQGFAGKMMENASKAMFFLLPAFALILKLLYIRSKRLYVEHLIFALHCHAFLFMTLAILSLINVPALSFMDAVVPFAIAFYFVAAMRAVYRQSIIKTVAKFMIAGVLYFILLFIAVAAVAALTFFSL